MQELDFILQDDLNLYCNLKSTISAAYKMKLTEDAERDFFERNMESYLLFTPATEFATTLKNYCHLEDTADTPYYYIRKDGRMASLFCVNEAGIITQRKYIFNLNKMADIYYCFESKLRKYKPKQNTLRSAAAKSVVLATAGAVAV